MNQEKPPINSDILLEAFLIAKTETESELYLTRLIENEIEPIIKNIFRRKLHVTLNETDRIR